jgi:hypothetical protein
MWTVVRGDGVGRGGNAIGMNLSEPVTSSSEEE